MCDNSAAVVDELFNSHRTFGLLRLEAQDLKAGDFGAVDRAYRWASNSFEMLSIQGQTVDRIRPVTTVEGFMDGFHRFFHLISASLSFGAFSHRNCCAVQQSFVVVVVNLQPAWWFYIQRSASHVPPGCFRCSDFLEPVHKQPTNLRLIRHPFAQ